MATKDDLLLDCIRSLIENVNDLEYFAKKRSWQQALDTLELVDSYSSDVCKLLKRKIPREK